MGKNLGAASRKKASEGKKKKGGGGGFFLGFRRYVGVFRGGPLRTKGTVRPETQVTGARKTSLLSVA